MITPAQWPQTFNALRDHPFHVKHTWNGEIFEGTNQVDTSCSEEPVWTKPTNRLLHNKGTDALTNWLPGASYCADLSCAGAQTDLKRDAHFVKHGNNEAITVFLHLAYSWRVQMADIWPRHRGTEMCRAIWTMSVRLPVARTTWPKTSSCLKETPRALKGNNRRAMCLIRTTKITRIVALCILTCLEASRFRKDWFVCQ